MVRALKPLRFIKIIRIMKVGKAGPLIAHLMDYWNISPKQGKTWRLMVVLVMSIHMVACAWWLWKVMGMKLDEVNDFLDAQSWGQYERSDLMTDEGKIEAYIIAVYVTTMTLTTVGYGDISADNTSERVGYIVLFIAGAFIWGAVVTTKRRMSGCLCKRSGADGKGATSGGLPHRQRVPEKFAHANRELVSRTLAHPTYILRH